MKAKTRILAMLLTALMVIGMLPLSIFAAGETLSDPVATVPGDSSWDNVNATLKAQGIDAYTYQNFENVPDSMFTDGVIDLPAVHRADWVGGTKDGEQMAATGVNYTSGNLYPFEIKNQKDAFSIKKESDGNKALFLGAAPKPASNDDNWFDIEMANVGAGSDILISLDFKMGGDQVAATNSFIFFIMRDVMKENGQWHNTGRRDINVMGLLSDGGLFLYDGGSSTEVVGYLSKNEYTRITVETDIANNKYYVYLNGVLVNPDGCQLMTDSLVNEAVGINPFFTSADLKFAEARICESRNNTAEHYHQGMFIDNILLAARIALKSSNSQNLNTYTMDLSGLSEDSIGKTLGDKVRVPGTSIVENNKPFINGATTDTAKNSVIYFKEADGSISIKYQRVATASSDSSAQTYLNYHMSDKVKSAVGQNVILSASYKAGSETIKGTNITPICRANGRNDMFSVTIRGDRSLAISYGNWKVNASDSSKKDQQQLRFGTLPVIPTDRFVNIEIHIICNTANDKLFVKVYVDGNIVGSVEITSQYTKQWTGQTVGGQVLTANTPYVDDVHFTSYYANAHCSMAADELHVKDVTAGYTDKYNTATSSGRFNPFANKTTGFVKAAGLNRYVENGVMKTADFVLGGESYAVATSGAVIGKYSDGVVQSSYAPYVDWAHAEGATYITNQPNGSDFWGSSTTMSTGRHAQTRNGIITNFGQACLYTSYDSGNCPYDKKQDGSSHDINSYYDSSFGANKNGSSVVFDFDIMLGDKLGEIDFMLRSRNAANKQSDFWALRIKNSGWLYARIGGADVKIAKLSQSEFNRISIVINTHAATGGNATYSVYLNGVMVVSEEVFYTGAEGSYVDMMRMFYCNGVANCYVKDYYTYVGTKPQQFCTMENGIAVLTSDQTKTPAKAADLKQGFVEEDGVLRYYDELGLPTVSKSIEVDGETYTFGANGNAICDGERHIDVGNGYCVSCKKIFDDVSTLYGNGLTLGSNVKVQFYLELDAENVKAIEIGIAGREIKTVAFEDLEIVYTEDDTPVYIVDFAVSGKDICTEITAKIVKSDDTYGTSYTYSAAQYARDLKYIPTNEVFTEELKALADALVVYGRSAAAVLLGGEAVEITGNVSFEDVENATGSPDLSPSPAVKLSSFSLELKSNIKFKLYFTVDEEAIMMNGSNIEDYKFTVNGEDVEYTVNDGIYCIEVEVVAAELGNNIAFRIYDGVSEFGLTLTASPLYYAKVIANSDKADANEKTLAKALKLYADAAAVYADSIASDNQ